jgi:hypothetical protein
MQDNSPPFPDSRQSVQCPQCGGWTFEAGWEWSQEGNITLAIPLYRCSDFDCQHNQEPVRGQAKRLKLPKLDEMPTTLRGHRLCDVRGCECPGIPCFMVDDRGMLIDEDDPRHWFCWEHAHLYGYCPDCGGKATHFDGPTCYECSETFKAQENAEDYWEDSPPAYPDYGHGPYY